MFDIIKLDNGLKIYLINDNNKHTTYINLIVKFGGTNREILINNKKFNIKSGTAHFLEHVVLECSTYGDLMSIFGSNGIRSNGLTSIDRTLFYIDTVKDANKYLELLIKGIHSPIINDENVLKIKNPILQEKRKSLDNKYSNLYNISMSNVIRKGHFNSVLGDFKDIKNINIDDLKTSFNTFYRPDNEIIVIGGNFNKKEIIDVIKKSYDSIEFNNDIIKEVEYKHIDKVNKKYVVIKDDVNIEKSIISFKINVGNISGYEKIMLDIYLYFFLRSNFGISSKLNKKLVDNNIILGNITYSSDILENMFIVRIEANIKDEACFNKEVLNYIKNKDYVLDKKSFDLYKKSIILDYVTRSDDIYRTVDPFIENILIYNYENIDTLEDIEKLNFEDYKRSINYLNFDTFNISVLKAKKN